MSDLLRQFGGFALGTSGGFHVLLWLAVTVSLCLLGMTLAMLGGALGQPVAVVIARTPARAGKWMAVVLLAVPLLLALMFVTLVLAPLSIVAGFALVLIGVVGYLAAAMLVGDRLGRAAGTALAPWASMLVGVLLFRLVRVVPVVGAPLHTLIAWFGLAAALAALCDAALAWHHRRLPDDVQFDNTTLIEWDEHGPRPPGPA